MSILKAKIGLIVASAVLSVLGSVNGQVVFQEDFDGAAGTGLNGTSPTIGTGTWSAAGDFFADGSIALTANSSASISIGDVINDTAGTPEGLFELSATLAPTVGTGNNWYSLGFSQLATPNNGMHFLNSNDGLGSILLRSNTCLLYTSPSPRDS